MALPGLGLSIFWGVRLSGLGPVGVLGLRAHTGRRACIGFLRALGSRVLGFRV